MTTTTTDKLEAVQQALELIEEATELLRQAGALDDPYFRAYSTCQLEGKERGWMGNDFLIDNIRRYEEQLIIDQQDEELDS